MWTSTHRGLTKTSKKNCKTTRTKRGCRIATTIGYNISMNFPSVTTFRWRKARGNLLRVSATVPMKTYSNVRIRSCRCLLRAI